MASTHSNTIKMTLVKHQYSNYTTTALSYSYNRTTIHFTALINVFMNTWPHNFSYRHIPSCVSNGTGVLKAYINSVWLFVDAVETVDHNMIH